jgi:hypothetical protein
MADKLPKGITKLSATTTPAASADSIAANVQTAADMHATLGQKIESVAAWLLNQLPGVFADAEEAIAAIKKLIAAA